MDSSLKILNHTPGLLTTGAVLDVGLKCTHSCAFCYYSYLDKSDDQFRGMRRASFRTHQDCRAILFHLKKNGFTHFDYTGGEPTLHPNIVELTQYAHQELGLRGRMITLGQFLLKKVPSCQRGGLLIEELLESGLTNFLFSTHAVEETLFKRITGESWGKLQEAMNYLDSRDFHYTSNTTVFEWNYQTLPQIAEEVLKHKVYMHNFIIMNAYYEWNQEGKVFGVQARYSDIYPYLKKAVEMLEANGVAVNIRYAPLCSLPGLEKNLVGGVGVRYDAYEWMNQAGHMGGTPEFCADKLKIHESGVDEDWIYTEDNLVAPAKVARRGGIKSFPEPCRNCKARSGCDGVDAKYLTSHGDSEFRPYVGPLKTGPVISERREYRPAFLVKWDQWVDMRSAIKNAFSDSSPTETALPVTLVLPEKNLQGGDQFTVPPTQILSLGDGVSLANGHALVLVAPGTLEVAPQLIEYAIEALKSRPEIDFFLGETYRQSQTGALTAVEPPHLSLSVFMMGWPISPVVVIRAGALSARDQRKLISGQLSIRALAWLAASRRQKVAKLGTPLVVVPAHWGGEMRHGLSFRRDWRTVTAVRNWSRAPGVARLALQRAWDRQRTAEASQ